MTLDAKVNEVSPPTERAKGKSTVRVRGGLVRDLSYRQATLAWHLSELHRPIRDWLPVPIKRDTVNLPAFLL